MTKPNVFILSSFFIISMMIGSDVANANLEIFPSETVSTIKDEDRLHVPDLGEKADGSGMSGEDAELAKPETSGGDSEETQVEEPDVSESKKPEEVEKESVDETPAEDAEGDSEETQVEEPDVSESKKPEEVEKESVDETPAEDAEMPKVETSEEEDVEGDRVEESNVSEEKAEEEQDEKSGLSPEQPLEKKAFLNFGLLFDVEFGDMTYVIQGLEDGGWKSELEWPLENVMYAGAEVSLNFKERWRLHAEFLKSVTDDAGTMKDSDWFYSYYDDRVAIYSETSATVDAYHLDMNLGYRFLQKTHVSLGASIGYAYKHWDWTAGGGYQWTIDPFSFYEGPITGPGLTYKEDVYIPYLGLDFAFLSSGSNIGVELLTLYSPFAVCLDESDHLLREKRGEGDTQGNFFAARGSIRWNLSSHWSLGARASIESFDLEGDQTQYFYGGDNAGKGVSGIDMKVKGTQSYLGLTLGYSL